MAAKGSVAAFCFENYATMWHQVHEMLHIERGGEDQIADDLAAYTPLIPQGRELVATVMFEIDDEARRHTFLAKLGGIEETAFLHFGGERVTGVPKADIDRTTADGKASAVQFIHFTFTDDQVEKFRSVGTEVIIGFDHSQYSHMAVMADAVRAALAEDFDLTGSGYYLIQKLVGQDAPQHVLRHPAGDAVAVDGYAAPSLLAVE